MSEKDWEDTVVVLKQYGGVTSPLEAEQLYTNEFVPAGDEFIPPQTGPDKILVRLKTGSKNSGHDFNSCWTLSRLLIPCDPIP
jgi:hypothetical protein